MNTLQAIYELREKRLALQRQVDKMEQEEKDLTYTLTNRMVSDNALTSTEDGFVAKRKTTQSPMVQDWVQTLNYIKATGSVDLLQKRLTESAVKARWDVGVDIPGVDKLVKHSVTITKE
jgi:hypothetical protein